MAKRLSQAIAVIFLLLFLFPSPWFGIFFSSEVMRARHYRPPQKEGDTLIESPKQIGLLSTWEKVVESTHFSVHYNVTGPSAVTDQYAVDVSDSLEYSWTREVTDFSFRQPPDSHMTVYIEDIWAYGITYFSGPPYHVLNITIDSGLTIDLIRETSAHEFFHTVQLSYDVMETDWIIEGTATWVMSKVYPYFTGSGSYVDWVNFYMNNPDRTITTLSYDAVLFWIFMEEHEGGMTTIENVLQQTTSRDGIDAVNATLIARGTTFAEAFKQWTIANYLKDSYYAKGSLFSQIAKTTFVYTGTRVQFSTDVADWGADYYETTSSVIYMEVQFSGTQYHNLTRIFVDYSSAIVSDILLDSTYSGSFRLMQADRLDEIVVIVRSIATETSAGSQNYILTWLGFSQRLSGPCELSSSSTPLNIRVSAAQGSSPIGLESFNPTTSQFSSTEATNVISKTPSQSSTSYAVSAIALSPSQSSSILATVAISNVTSQTSSETPAEVIPIPPVVSFYYSPLQPCKNETVTFDASLSYDPDGYVVSYNWNFGDGNITNAVTPITTHVYTTAGSYDVVLNITDNQGSWSTLSKPITIYESVLISVDIKNLVLTDQNGIPKTSFSRGDVAQFNFTIENAGGLPLTRGLVPVMVLDPSNTPLFLSYTFEDIGPGAYKEFIIGYGIPLDAPMGTYTVKIMVFTNWPSQGGVGLDIETRTFSVS